MGRKILTYSSCDKKGRGYVTIDGNRINIKAEIHGITGYSAHAGQDNLVRWVRGFREKPKRIFLVHGEIEAKRVLKKELNAIGLEVVIAKRKKYSVVI